MQWLMNRLAALSQRVRQPERFWPDPVRTIFLVTYPRSGTTWISCVAAELLFQISPRNLREIGSGAKNWAPFVAAAIMPVPLIQGLQ